MSETKSWAIITGASSGIGRALAGEFAERGFALVLTGRDLAALDEIASKCKEMHSATVMIHAADLSDAVAVARLIESIKEKPIELLVNNAGFGLKGNFAETNIEMELQMVEVQVTAMLRLTKAVLPSMIARGHGRILNIASVYSVASVPRQSIYSACKAFLLSFSTTLSEELRGTGVTVTVCLPGVTKTEFRRRAGITDRGASGMTPEAVAQRAAAATMRGRHRVTPGFQNRLFVFAARHLPARATSRLVRFINDRRGVNR
ncbi:MAG: SDR family NAD(P)-dependent oxidoreductase [Pyrinomonadaceae bacterium]